MKREKTTFKQKLLLLLLSFFLTLSFIELGFGRWIILSAQRLHNEATNENATYIILALGESTTAGTFFTWPVLLEQILNNKSSKMKFKVFNEGIGSADTNYIAGKLSENLEKYNPDMVVTMMGVNDGIYQIKRAEDFWAKIENIFSSLRIYKIARMILYNGNSFFLSSTQNSPLAKTGNKSLPEKQKNISNDADYYVNKGFYYRDIGELGNAKTMFIIALQMNNKSGGAYHGLGWIYNKEGRYEEAENMYLLSSNYNPTDSYTYFLLGYLYRDTGKANLSQEMFEKAAELNPDDAELRLLSISTYKTPFQMVDDYKKYFGILVVPFEERSFLNVTRSNYNYVYSMLKNRKIKYAAMMYPTLDIKPVMDFFPNNSGIIFVSNEYNFKTELNNMEYKDLFIDDFGIRQDIASPFYGRFGHATAAGNKLIAENAADAILKEFNIT